MGMVTYYLLYILMQGLNIYFLHLSLVENFGFNNSNVKLTKLTIPILKSNIPFEN